LDPFRASSIKILIPHSRPTWHYLVKVH